jgi:hypothetical protein
MLRSLLLVAVLNVQPVPADFRQCTITHNQPLFPEKHINGTAPVSSIV